MTIFEIISTSTSLGQAFNFLWNKNIDFKNELISAFTKALKEAGYKDRIPLSESTKALQALQNLIGSSEELNLSVDSKEVLKSYRKEIATNKILSHYLTLLSNEFGASQRNAILKEISQLSKDLEPPRHFRKLINFLDFRVEYGRHPNLNDFKNGAYYKNEVFHNTIKDYLDKNKIALVLGKPGSGKTALALGVGYEFIKSGYESYYIRAQKIRDAITIINEINKYSNPNALFIIDDAHLAQNEISVIIERYRQFQANLLIISRTLSKNFSSSTEVNYIEALESKTVQVSVNKNTIPNIIERLPNRKNIQKEDIGDTQKLLKKCEQDLHLLQYYVDAWLVNRTQKISDIKEHQVLEEVYNEYLKDNDHINDLLKIAALSQYEILVESLWIDNDAIQENVLINSFDINIRYGWGNIRPYWFLEYFHSTPAKYLVKAGQHLQKLNKRTYEEFTFDILTEYLKSKPINFLDVFYNLYQNEGKGLQEKLFKQSKAFTWFREWLSQSKYQQYKNAFILKNLCPFLIGVQQWNEEERNKLLTEVENILDFEALGQRTRQDEVGLGTITKFISYGRSAGIADEHIRMFCSGLDFEALGQRAREEEDVSAVANIFREFKRTGVTDERIQTFVKGIGSKGFQVLGERARRDEVGSSTIMTMISRGKLAGIADEHIRMFCSGLDFEALGQRAREDKVGLGTVSNIITKAIQVGVANERIQEFGEGLGSKGFQGLGEHACQGEVGLGTNMNFINYGRRAGISDEYIRGFCSGLDFEALGQRAREDKVGLATIRLFIQISMRVGVANECIQEFWKGLGSKGFQELGQRTREDKVGLATIFIFIQKSIQAEATYGSLLAFCSELDWRWLGEQAINEDYKFRNPLKFLDIILKTEAITSNNTLDFLKSIGWDKIRREMQTNFSPDILAVLRILLIHKCHFSTSQLRDLELTWHPKRTWFKAYISNPSSQDINYYSHKNYMTYAFIGLQNWDIRQMLLNEKMSLKNWNIFIHNISQTYRDKVKEEIQAVKNSVSSILKYYSNKELENLFAQSNFRNISIFFNHFDPNKEPTFEWFIDNNIDFKKVKFEDNLEKCSLEDLGFFLFNFHYVGLKNWAYYFSEKLKDHKHQLIKLCDEADIETIDFFLWNWWMANSTENLTKIAYDSDLIEIITNKTVKSKKDKSCLLGIIGTLHLSGLTVSDSLKNKIDANISRQLCLGSLENQYIKPLRKLGGLWAISENELSNEEKEKCIGYLNKLNFQLSIPNQEEAERQLRNWLKQ